MLRNMRVLITGCSGGGKSRLLTELTSMGHTTIAEPGRRIVAQERAGTGQALPWVDMTAFARRAVAMAQADLLSVQGNAGLVFFDRGLIDAAVALEASGGESVRETLGDTLQYAKTVFLAPPWPEIFLQDIERQHDFVAANQEFIRIEAALMDLGFDICLLPKRSVTERAAFVLDRLKAL